MTAVPPDRSLDRQRVPDSQYGGLVARLPPTLRGLAMLARFDRPIGWWLLFWPSAWAVALAGGVVERWRLIAWLLVGSIAMRGAGCVYNDIVDRDLDAAVARTAARPIPAGLVGVRTAWAWLVALSLVGLVVLVQLGTAARVVALASLLLVAAYPFMKRITGFPQAWLGLVFSWAAPVAWVETAGWPPGGGGWAAGALLWGGSIAWVIGYDTVYACQDREDDRVIGIGSSALTLGRYVRAGVAGFYLAAMMGWAAAVWLVRPDPLVLLALAPAAVQLGWQAATLRPDDGAGVLARFRSNRFAGLLVFLACVVVAS